MTQQEVINYLKKNPNTWFSAKELNEILKFSNSASNLKRLFECGEVFRRTRIRNGWEYKFR